MLPSVKNEEYSCKAIVHALESCGVLKRNSVEERIATVKFVSSKSTNTILSDREIERGGEGERAIEREGEREGERVSDRERGRESDRERGRARV